MSAYLKKSFLVLACAGITLALAACNRGPLERAGKSVDDAVEKTGDAIKDAGK